MLSPASSTSFSQGHTLKYLLHTQIRAKGWSRKCGWCTKTPTTSAASPSRKREWETLERIWCDLVSTSIPMTQGCRIAAYTRHGLTFRAVHLSCPAGAHAEMTYLFIQNYVLRIQCPRCGRSSFAWGRQDSCLHSRIRHWISTWIYRWMYLQIDV